MIVKVKFLKDGQETGGPYTYFSNDVVAVGDTVQINESAKGVVTDIDVPEIEIEDFKDKVKTIIGKLETFYFTFCGDGENAGHYIKITACGFSEAREEMFKMYGDKWAFQYAEKEWKDWELRAKQTGCPIETELKKVEEINYGRKQK